MTEAWTVEDLRRVLAETDERDFDGHSHFVDLTPAQRLDALGHMTAVRAEFKGLARPSVVGDACGRSGPSPARRA